MRRSGFSMIELVFVIVILGVLAAVAVPKFVATRTDAKVATLRSDAASVQKAIVAKVFADDIDTTTSKAPVPNMKAADAMLSGKTMDWGDWMIEIGGLDKKRWMKLTTNSRGISPVFQWRSMGNVDWFCNDGTGSPMIEITTGGDLSFQPQKLASTTSTDTDNLLCRQLKASYKNSDGYGNRTIPLSTTGTISF